MEKIDEEGKKQQDIDFYGVVTFEIDFGDIVGMEYTNMLIENSSRIVFEGKSIKKKSFQTLADFFQYYDLN